MGRPRKEINTEDLTRLCRLQPTDAEIAAFFSVSEDTITRRKQDDEAFAEAYKTGKEEGKTSLRRAMWKSALEKGNVAMQIFLSKNLLGMRDRFPDESDNDYKKFALHVAQQLKSLDGVTKGLDSNT